MSIREFRFVTNELERVIDFISDERCKLISITAKLCITSLNSHFPHQKPQPKILRKRKRSQGLRIFLV